ESLVYNPRLDPFAHERKEELMALHHAGWIRRGTKGNYLIRDEAEFLHRIKQVDKDYGLLGCQRWAARAEIQFKGVARNMSMPESVKRQFVHVSIKGDDKKQPLNSCLSDATIDRYLRAGKRIDKVALESRPQYLVERSNSVGRATWWLDHAVIRRQLRNYEQRATYLGEEHIRAEIYRIRRGVEAMDYQSLREGRTKTIPKPNRQRVSDEAFQQMLNRAKGKGDLELHDALVLSKATGLRPIELQRGVSLNTDGKKVSIDIHTAKKYDGNATGHARYKAARGVDRTLESSLPELQELAHRHHNNFQPISTSDQLRTRLNELRRDIPDAQHVSFYTFRHQFKTDLEEQGATSEYIKYALGHRSKKSQEAYGTR
ncbi:MAG: site-specific integrase, partial [Chloroflexota bacterium]